MSFLYFQTVTSLPMLFGPILMGAHLSEAWVWFTMFQIDASIHHSNYHFPFLSSPQFHDYHHVKWVIEQPQQQQHSLFLFRKTILIQGIKLPFHVRSRNLVFPVRGYEMTCVQFQKNWHGFRVYSLSQFTYRVRKLWDNTYKKISKTRKNKERENEKKNSTYKTGINSNISKWCHSVSIQS